MKRIGNLYDKIISLDNLRLADEKARKGKGNTYGVKKHDRNRESNILKLHEQLKNKTFKTSEYHIFIIHDPKEREIYQLPYFPDRIVHHAILNIVEPLWISTFIRDTYACVKGRGVHDGMRRVKKALQTDRNGTRYCLKLDIKKFYPSIDHGVLKSIIRKKIKCEDTLALLDGIIDSADGLPIGNGPSQHMANLFLTPLDHELKQRHRVKYYFRYADDLVILHADKKYLHGLLVVINNHLQALKLSLKDNYQIFPVESRGVDFLGFVFRHSHIRMRKSIKQNFARKLSRVNKKNLPLKEYKREICGYIGWVKYSDSKHFAKTNIQHNEKIFLCRDSRNS